MRRVLRARNSPPEATRAIAPAAIPSQRMPPPAAGGPPVSGRAETTAIAISVDLSPALTSTTMLPATQPVCSVALATPSAAVILVVVRLPMLASLPAGAATILKSTGTPPIGLPELSLVVALMTTEEQLAAVFALAETESVATDGAGVAVGVGVGVGVAVGPGVAVGVGVGVGVAVGPGVAVGVGVGVGVAVGPGVGVGVGVAVGSGAGEGGAVAVGRGVALGSC